MNYEFYYANSTLVVVVVVVCAAVTPGAQLLEQTARLQSLSDTLGRLKVSVRVLQMLTG